MTLNATINGLRTFLNLAPPHLARSLDEFLRGIDQEKAHAVIAHPHVGPDSFLWGMLHRMRVPENYSRWRHYTIYHAFSKPGRTLTLREHYGRWRDDPDCENPFEARRDLAQLKHYVTMQARLDEIRRRTPGIRTRMEGPTGAVDDLNSHKLKLLAGEGVQPFSVVAYK